MGRPLGSTNKKNTSMPINEAARAHTQDAIRVLAEIMKSTECAAADRVKAAVALLDRGYGKPTEHVEHGGAFKFERTPLIEMPQKPDAA